MRYNNIQVHHIDDEDKILEDVFCPRCNEHMKVIRTKVGVKLYQCLKCKYTSKNIPVIYEKNNCPKCGKKLIVHKARFGEYVGCVDYPKCRFSEIINKKAMPNNEYEKKFKKGNRDDIKGDVMSSWEANIIRLFDYLKIDYEYESDGFILDKSESNYEYLSFSYVPDFVLSDGTLIEVKGNLDYRSLQNMKRFKELYPKENIIVIDRDIYYLLDKKYSSLISNWEKAPNNLTCYISVVGITFKERKQYVDKLKENDELYIVRELDNKFDKNAIKVLDKDNNHIGYVSGEYACYYAPKIDKGIKYKLVLKERKEKALRCSIHATNLDSYDVSNYLDIFK